MTQRSRSCSFRRRGAARPPTGARARTRAAGAAHPAARGARSRWRRSRWALEAPWEAFAWGKPLAWRGCCAAVRGTRLALMPSAPGGLRVRPNPIAGGPKPPTRTAPPPSIFLAAPRRARCARWPGCTTECGPLWSPRWPPPKRSSSARSWWGGQREGGTPFSLSPTDLRPATRQHMRALSASLLVTALLHLQVASARLPAGTVALASCKRTTASCSTPSGSKVAGERHMRV
jgi:hypothetical protein